MFATCAFAATPKAEKAAATKAAAVAKTKVATGTIVSSTDTNLTISHKVKGKAEETSFAITPDTKKEGELAAGSKASVHYTTDGTANTATAVKTIAPRAAAPKAAKAEKKSAKKAEPKVEAEAAKQ